MREPRAPFAIDTDVYVIFKKLCVLAEVKTRPFIMKILKTFLKEIKSIDDVKNFMNEQIRFETVSQMSPMTHQKRVTDED